MSYVNHLYPERWRGISPGDSVTGSTPQGGTISGRVVIVEPKHVVINIGGTGCAGIVDDNNFVRHRRKRTPKP